MSSSQRSPPPFALLLLCSVSLSLAPLPTLAVSAAHRKPPPQPVLESVYTGPMPANLSAVMTPDSLAQNHTNRSDAIDAMEKILAGSLSIVHVNKSSFTVCEHAVHACKRYCPAHNESCTSALCVPCKMDYEKGLSPLCIEDDTCEDYHTCWVTPKKCTAPLDFEKLASKGSNATVHNASFSNDPVLEEVPSLTPEKDKEVKALLLAAKTEHRESESALNKALQDRIDLDREMGSAEEK